MSTPVRSPERSCTILEGHYLRPLFDKYESYVPKDVRDFLLGNTMIRLQRRDQYLGPGGQPADGAL